jgi:large subunit ribosomal protein L35
MPKVKTNSSSKKRFKVSATGKIKHKKAGKRHNLDKKSQKRIRNLRKGAIVSSGHSASLMKFKMPNNY